MKRQYIPSLKPTMAAIFLLSTGLALEAKNIVVTTPNNDAPPAGQTSLKQAISQLADGDVIQFNLPGAGPHVIVTPIGGYPVITANNVSIDGYSQPGSKPNSNGILGGNNAVIGVVLDSSGVDTLPSPDSNEPDLILTRSTRILGHLYGDSSDNNGYGDGENGILVVYQGDGFKVRGLGFIGHYAAGNTADPSIYGVALVKEAKNAKVQGCWFGIMPGAEYTQENIKPVTDAVTAYRWRDTAKANSVFSTGLVFGTDGDGTADVQEFNVVVGTHVALGLEAGDVRISGNYINVFPDGLTFVNVETLQDAYLAVPNGGNDTIEFMENGRDTANTLIGTNGDNKSDGNERNIIAHPNYKHAIEFYGADTANGGRTATNTVVAGNYFGVGIDGVTAQAELTVKLPNLIGTSGGDYRVGSNGDGVSDDIEGNLIVNTPGLQILEGTLPAVIRRNTMINNAFDGFPFADGSGGRTYATYFANAVADPAAGAIPAITSITAGIMTGTLPVPSASGTYTKSVVDVYVVDTKSADKGVILPGRYAGSFVDNGSGDLDAAANKFRVDLRGMKVAPDDKVVIAVTYTAAAAGTPGANSLTGPLSPSAVADIPVLVPGSVESVGLTRIVPDKPIIVPQNDALGNWEPYISVLGTSTFLIEGSTFADGFDATDGKQRYVVALQPTDGKPGKTVEGFYADNKTPYKGPINASRQNGNPGRVAGDRRPGATRYIVGAEASPHTLSEFGSDNRWTLGFDRLSDGRYGTVQTYNLDTTTLVPTPIMKAADSSNGRLTSGTAAGSQISRFGGDVAGLDNGNFVSVVEDRGHVLAAGDAVIATIFAADGTIVKDAWVVANGDIWANVASYQGGFAVRCKPQDGAATRVIYLFDNAGNLKNTIAQTSSGASYDNGRGDGTRIAGHINSPYIFLFGQPAGSTVMKVAAWDTRNPDRVALFDASEPAFGGGFDRANLAVDALNRITVAWVSKPDGYEQQQVAARVLALNGDTMTITALTPSFLAFVNQAKTGDIRSVGMSVAMTTKQICIAAKGEINLQNKPANGATVNLNTGGPLKEINFYTVFSHPSPQDDPTPSASAKPIVVTATRQAQDVTITWTGGTGPFLVQTSPVLGTWIDTVTTADRTVTLPLVGGAGYIRVLDGATKTVQVFKAHLDAAQEPNKPASTATGAGMAIIEGLKLTYYVSYEGLTTGLTASHIHNGAVGVAGPVSIGFTPLVGSFSGIISGTATMTADQKAAIVSGGSYFNIHTTKFGGGEIRGQILP